MLLNELPIAYIDPGSGAMVLQVVIASILGASLYFRRILFAPVLWFKSLGRKDEMSETEHSAQDGERSRREHDESRRAA
ncbi:MAG: hypothetical protein R3C05_23955 [Pirellulaceae bacterium]